MTTCFLVGITDTTGKEVQSTISLGSSNQILTSNGSNELPSFQNATTPSGSGVASVSATLSAGLVNATGDGTVVTLPCDTVVWQNGTAYNTTTGHYTCPQAGIYLVFGNCNMTYGAGATNYNCSIALNGTQYIQNYNTLSNQGVNGYIYPFVSGMVKAALNDVITVTASADDGSKNVTIYSATIQISLLA
jgi:hypothetical protein